MFAWFKGYEIFYKRWSQLRTVGISQKHLQYKEVDFIQQTFCSWKRYQLFATKSIFDLENDKSKLKLKTEFQHV